MKWVGHLTQVWASEQLPANIFNHFKKPSLKQGYGGQLPAIRLTFLLLKDWLSEQLYPRKCFVLREMWRQKRTKQENILTHWSVVQAGSNDERNCRSKISLYCPFKHIILIPSNKHIIAITVPVAGRICFSHTYHTWTREKE